VFDYSLFEERDASTDRRDALEGMADELFGFDRREPPDVARVYSAPRTGAIVKVHAFLPPCTITPSSWVSRTFEAAGLPDIDFESDEFNRGWDVRCADRRFADLFVDAQLIDLILSLDDKVALETFGNYVLFTARFAKPAHVARLLHAAQRLRSVVSPLVTAEYPSATAMEARSSMDAWNARPDGRGGAY
jgi:hypothetical protein